jgi:hypothetical protein
MVESFPSDHRAVERAAASLRQYVLETTQGQFPMVRPAGAIAVRGQPRQSIGAANFVLDKPASSDGLSAICYRP